MSQTVAYIRVSTEEQIEYSPDAQAKRCRDLAQVRGLGPVIVLADEGWSGTNLARPRMRELIKLIEAGEVTNVIVWRWDRLCRDQGDSAYLVKLFDRCGVKVFSVSDGEINVSSASGKMQVGVHGVFAQYYRDQIVENSRMGQLQAFENGRWLNRAPTGYFMVNGYLEPNEKAPLVQRAFELRASGASYPVIAREIGIEYSTVHHICANRVYLGQTRLGNLWGPGIHAPLVNEEQFNATQRATRPGRRRGKDFLSGKVRCGLCLRVTCVTYNERNQLIYRCKERGQGCSQPGRSANGLYRATMIAFRELRGDADLRLANPLTANRGAACGAL